MDNSVTENAADINQTQVAIEQNHSAQPTERVFRQAELNDIVGRAKHDAVESFKRQQAQHQQSTPAQHDTQSLRGLSEDDVRRLTSEELSRQRDSWTKEAQEKSEADAAKRIVDAYKEKIATGRERYDDFEAVTNNVDMRYYPNVVQLLAEYVDNSADVLYDLAQHRTKLGQIEQLCSHNPQDAIYEIKRLSDSIKSNDKSSSMKHANAPLSQQRPSNTGTDSGTTLSMKDLKLKYKA
jgi:hypothetical protein